jgi:hypothetical protein
VAVVGLLREFAAGYFKTLFSQPKNQDQAADLASFSGRN